MHSGRRVRIQPLWVDEVGATAAEYAVIAALIAGVLVGAVAILGMHVQALFSSIPAFWGG